MSPVCLPGGVLRGMQNPMESVLRLASFKECFSYEGYFGCSIKGLQIKKGGR